MAKEYNVDLPGHPSIYDPHPRELHIEFCEPEQGINGETGLLLIVSGFGGSVDSVSFKELRKYAADKYNLVSIQCKYFGNEFMQNSFDLDINLGYLKRNISEEDFSEIAATGQIPDIYKLCEKYELTLEGIARNKETYSNFNDMGLMQALDNIYSIIAVAAIIQDNGYPFDHGKIIAYGESHGAYLSYLCNAFCPGMFSLIIDNSAWLYPVYLFDRQVHKYVHGKSTTTVYTDYLARSLPQDEELQRLPLLYDKFSNNADIIALHGTTDHFYNYKGKIEFLKNINHSKYKIISPEEVDGRVFKSSGHCFGSSSCDVFDDVMKNHNFKRRDMKYLDLRPAKYETSKYLYLFDYTSGAPVLNRKEKPR